MRTDLALPSLLFAVGLIISVSAQANDSRIISQGALQSLQVMVKIKYRRQLSPEFIQNLVIGSQAAQRALASRLKPLPILPIVVGASQTTLIPIYGELIILPAAQASSRTCQAIRDN